jgi:hypothetical protein
MCALNCRVQQVMEPLQVAPFSESLKVNKMSLVLLSSFFCNNTRPWVTMLRPWKKILCKSLYENLKLCVLLDFIPVEYNRLSVMGIVIQ